MKKYFIFAVVLILALAIVPNTFAAKSIGVNVVLNTEVTDEILAELGAFGKVQKQFIELKALTMKTTYEGLAEIQALSFVESANPDAERNGVPITTVAADNFADGLSTWDLDAINVTDYGYDNRQVAYDGTGVYVAVLDTGLVDTWRSYFPEERIAVEFAKSFGGGGGENGNVSEQPNKWEHDQNSHGTHVTSTILGYDMSGTPINGVAPMATIIPVKVLNQNGSGWSSVIAEGIVYVADLKLSGALGDSPVVINMSLGGSALDAVEKAAIDYAIEAGVIIVASAGNNGEAGMGYPGAYEPVISVGATGWAFDPATCTGEWAAVIGTSCSLTSGFWTRNFPEGINASANYVTDFSARELPGQDLDVLAPGSWIVGPYKVNSGNELTYYFLGGTSMASPHVAGVAALLLQKDSTLTQADVDFVLTSTADPIPGPGAAYVADPNEGQIVVVTWGADAVGSGLVQADAALNALP